MPNYSRAQTMKILLTSIIPNLSKVNWSILWKKKNQKVLWRKKKINHEKLNLEFEKFQDKKFIVICPLTKMRDKTECKDIRWNWIFMQKSAFRWICWKDQMVRKMKNFGFNVDVFSFFLSELGKETNEKEKTNWNFTIKMSHLMEH